jgi:hypothetical protein
MADKILHNKLLAADERVLLVLPDELFKHVLAGARGKLVVGGGVRHCLCD